MACMLKRLLLLTGLALATGFFLAGLREPASTPVGGNATMSASESHLSVVQLEQNCSGQPFDSTPDSDETLFDSEPVIVETMADDAVDPLRDWPGWAGADPESALVAALQLPDTDERNDALEGVCLGIAGTDPAAAVNLAGTLSLDKRGVMAELIQQWATVDLASACAWLRENLAGEQREELFARLAFVWSQTEPSNAAELVLDQISPGPAQTEAVMMVLHQWAIRNLVAAARWVEQFPEGQIRDRAIDELEGIARTQTASGDAAVSSFQ